MDIYNIGCSEFVNEVDKLPLKGCIVSGIGTVQSVSVRVPSMSALLPLPVTPTSQPVSHSALPSTPKSDRCKEKGRNETAISSIPQCRSDIDFQYLLSSKVQAPRYSGPSASLV